MTSAEIRAFKLDVLDDLHELFQDPVADPEPINGKIDAFLRRVEAEIGEKDHRE